MKRHLCIVFVFILLITCFGCVWEHDRRGYDGYDREEHGDWGREEHGDRDRGEHGDIDRGGHEERR